MTKIQTTITQKLHLLDKLAKKTYIFYSSKEEMVFSIRLLRKTIEKTRIQALKTKKTNLKEYEEEIKKLNTKAFQLVKLTREFKNNCWFGSSLAKKTQDEISLWALGLAVEVKEIEIKNENQKKLKEPTLVKTKQTNKKLLKPILKKEKTNPSFKIETIDPSLLKDTIKELVPQYQILNVSSLAQLMEIDKKLKSCLSQISVDDHELQNLWWDQNKRLLPYIHKLRICCSIETNVATTSIFDDPINATSIFSLVNLGPCMPSKKGLVLDCSLTFSLAIKTMEQMLQKKVVPNQELKKFTQLLNAFKAGFRIANLQKWNFDHNQSYLTTEQILKNKKLIKDQIIYELKTQNFVILATGYLARPMGHAIALALSIREVNGKRLVKGEIINRGEGVNFHGMEAFQGFKTRVNPYLQLGEVNLEDLENCTFFDLMNELYVLKTPLSNAATDFSIFDFYDGLLTNWPQPLPLQLKKVECRGLQHGENCTFKCVITIFRDRLSTELARISKLMMRIETLEMYLLKGDLLGSPDAFLKWTLKKINRTLCKLEKHTLSDSFKTSILEEFNLQKRYCRLLSEKVVDIIEDTKKKRLIAVDPELSVVDVGQNVFTYKVAREHIHIPIEGRKEVTIATPYDIGKVEEYLNTIAASRDQNIEWSERFAKSFLEKFPLASDSFWKNPKLVENQKVLLVERIKDDLDSYLPVDDIFTKTNTGRTIAIRINILVGILVSLQNSFSKEYIVFKALRLLSVIHLNGSQLRTGYPDSDEMIGVSIQKLKELSENQDFTPLNIEINNDQYIFDRRPCDTMEDIANDVVLQDRCNRIPLDKRSAYDVVRLYPLSDRPTLNLENLMLRLEDDLILELCFSGLRSPAIEIEHKIINEFGKTYRMMFVSVYNILNFRTNLTNPTHHFNAPIVHHLYDWSNEDQLVAQELLDPRFYLQSKIRNSQNEHIKASASRFPFANVILKKKEIERLLSVFTYEQNFIPQILHCFAIENSFHLLAKSEFQALLQGFLLTKTSTGEETLLVKNLKSGGTALAFSLMEFIWGSINKSKENGWLETQLFLLYLAAQMIAHFPNTVDQKFTATTLQTLKKNIKNVKSENQEPAHKNIIGQWLIAIHPFVKYFPQSKGKGIEKQCILAYTSINDNYQHCYFNGLKFVQESYKLGLDELIKKTKKPFYQLILPESLFSKYSDVLNDKHPTVSLLPTGELRFHNARDEIFTLKNPSCPAKRGLFKRFEDGQDYFWSSVEDAFGPSIHSYLDDCYAWGLNGKKSTVLLTTKKNKLVACFNENQINHPTDPNLTLVSNQIISKNGLSSPFPFLQKLANLSSKTLVWKEKTTNLVTRFEIPDMDLTFIREVDAQGNIAWICPQHHNMRVDFKKKIAEVEPFLHYIVLKGEKKQIVLVVKKEIHMANEGASFSASLPTTKQHNEYYTFALKKNKIVLPYNVEPVVYLILLAMQSHQYEKALDLIKKLNGIDREWSNQALSMLDIRSINEVEQQDQSLYACALRLSLFLLRTRFRKDLPNYVHHLSLLRKDYETCLDELTLGNDWWISPQDELEIIKMLSHHINDKFKIRKKQLLEHLKNDPQKKSETTDTPLILNKGSATPFRPAISVESYQAFEWITLEHFGNMHAARKKPFQLAYLLRPGYTFIHNFLYYYHIACNWDNPDSPNEKMLIELLKITRFGSIPEIELLRRLLHHIILTRSKAKQSHIKFPPLETLNYLQLKEALKSLWTELFGMDIVRYDTERHWGFDYLLDIKDLNTSQLKPKSAVFHFDTLPLPLLIEPKTAVSGISTIDLKKEFLTNGFIIPQSNALDLIKKEIDDLLDLESIYKSGRVLEGIKERIAELNDQLKKLESGHNDSFYCVPTSDAASQMKPCNEAFEIQWKPITDWLNSYSEQAKKKARELKNEIEKLANKRTHTFAQVLGEINGQKHLKLNEILLHFARNESAIKSCNSELTHAKFLELKKLVLSYLIAKTDFQHFERALAHIEKINKMMLKEDKWTSPAIEQAKTSFITTIIQERAYKLEEGMCCLVYEAFSNIRLFKEQYEALNKLTKDGDFELEARTGFGKTKVLVPLWLLLNSQPGKIVTFTTTSSLLNDQIEYLTKLLGSNTFNLGFEVVNFNKEKGDSFNYLQILEERLERAKINGGKIFLFQIDSMHGLSSLALRNHLFQNQLKDCARSLLSIRKKLKEGKHFVDESTACFNIKHTFDYATGKPRLVETQHCRQSIEFFKKVICNKAILAKWRFEFLTDEQYHALTGSSQLPTKAITDNDLEELFLNLACVTADYLKVPLEHREAVLNHFLGFNPKLAKPYFSQLSKKKQKQYVYCFYQLREHLRITLLKNCGERYEVGTNGLALPYEGGSPKPNNEFASLDHLMNFTIQANIKRPISTELVFKFIDKVQEYANRTGQDITDTGIGQLYRKIERKLATLEYHLPNISKLKGPDKLEIAKLINNPKYFNIRLEFIGTRILSSITTLPNKVSNNCYTLFDALGIVHAASGTVNTQTLPPRMKTIEKKSAMISNLLAIWKNSLHLISVIDSEKGNEFLTKLLEGNRNFRVLIDAGGFFRDHPQKEIIDIILKVTEGYHPPIKGVVFYDNDRNCRVWPRGQTSSVPQEESQLNSDELFIYIRQSHAVGSDVQMPKYAKGICTVSHQTQEKFLFQAFGRMRHLADGEIINFVIKKSDEIIIKKRLKLQEGKNIELSDLLIHSQQREIEQNQKDYFFALKKYLKNCIESQLWTKECDLHRLHHYFKLLSPILLDSNESDPSLLFQDLTSVSAEVAVKSMQDQMLKQLEQLVAKDKGLELVINFEEIKFKFEKFLKYEYLPAKISLREESTDEVTCEVQVDNTQDQEKEIDVDNERELAVSSAFSFTPAAVKPWDGDYRQLFSLQEVNRILDIPVIRSPNLHVIAEDLADNNNLLKAAYQFILQLSKEGHASLIALDLFDMEQAIIKMRGTSPSDTDIHSYYMLSNNRVIAAEGSQRPVEWKKLIKNENVRNKICIITRILSGGSVFTFDERRWIKKELKNEKNVKSFIELLNKTTGVWPDQEPLRALVTDQLTP